MFVDSKVKKAGLFLFLLCIFYCLGRILTGSAYEGACEKLIYAITPLGRAEYNDLGQTELEGRMVDLITFRTQVFGFDDTERIYSSPESGLPLRVERDISMWLGHEKIIEDYDQKDFIVTMRKFKGKKQVEKTVFKGDGPMHNAILLPFYLRRVPSLAIGWTYRIRLTKPFDVKLVAIEDIKVPAGSFKAYHFTSSPDKFEMWISIDPLRLPLMIKGVEGLGYRLSLMKRSVPEP